jgi:hypothetical protein
MTDPLQRLIGQRVVLDTGSMIVYIGTLTELTDTVFVLGEADLHDCRDGHANKESYVARSAREDVSVNRRGVVVMRSAIMSVSLLSDVIAE